MKRALLPLAPLLAVAVLLGAGGPASAEAPVKRPSDEERGKTLFDRHCEACHGMYNKGHGPATQALVHEVPDLEGKTQVNDRTIHIVLRGKGAMPGYEQTFDRFDAKRVLDHMAGLKVPAPGEEPAEKPEAELPVDPDLKSPSKDE